MKHKLHKSTFNSVYLARLKLVPEPNSAALAVLFIFCLFVCFCYLFIIIFNYDLQVTTEAVLMRNFQRGQNGISILFDESKSNKCAYKCANSMALVCAVLLF